MGAARPEARNPGAHPALFFSDGTSPFEFGGPALQVQVQPGTARARRVVSRRNARVTGKYPSVKMGRLMHWESLLERDALTLLDVDAQVLRYREQPAHMNYDDGHTAFTHYPDLLIESHGTLYFAEVKADEKARAEPARSRRNLLAAQLRQFGFGYHLLSESELRRQPRLDNARLIRRYGYGRPDPGLSAHLIERAEAGRLTWDALTEDAQALATACYLIITGYLTLPWDEPIMPNTPITRMPTE